MGLKWNKKKQKKPLELQPNALPAELFQLMNERTPIHTKLIYSQLQEQKSFKLFWTSQRKKKKKKKTKCTFKIKLIAVVFLCRSWKEALFTGLEIYPMIYWTYLSNTTMIKSKRMYFLFLCKFLISYWKFSLRFHILYINNCQYADKANAKLLKTTIRYIFQLPYCVNFLVIILFEPKN